jgi:23S rRNA pseudouridine2605 synthase
MNKPTRKPSNKKPRKPPSKPASKANKPQRLNRYLATCGLCSRREADRWISEGRVSINGQTVQALGTLVQADDRVQVDGKEAQPAAEFTYLLYHKPRGLLCSRQDAKGRPLIYDHLDIGPAVQSVGRLDMDSEGLLLLTDDGDLTRRLTHPASKLARNYRVRVAGHVSLDALETLRRGGVDIGKGDVSDPWDVIVDAETRGHTWLSVTIRRGRWREVRRTLEAHGHQVRRLIRVAFGPIRLDADLPPGAWRKLKGGEIHSLKNAAKQR